MTLGVGSVSKYKDFVVIVLALRREDNGGGDEKCKKREGTRHI